LLEEREAFIQWRDEEMRKESSQPPAVFSCIAKNSISHFSQETGNCESVKEEGIREPSEREGVSCAYEEPVGISPCLKRQSLIIMP
jgi:hypothetical protein